MVATFTLTSDSSTDTPSYSETIDITGEGEIEFIGLAYNGTYILSEASMTGFADVGDITIEVVNGIIYVDNNEIVQIVIEYVTIDGQGIYNLAEGINDSILDEYLLTYIRESGITIKISTADGANPAIENENATTDNYTVRWYVLKEQVDGWHIDGVMVAKTAEITITKTFSGEITYAQLQEIYEASTSANNGTNYNRLPFYIELEDGNGTIYKLYLQDAATRSSPASPPSVALVLPSST
ncbi:MAG: hypothetical protein LUC38_00815 [Oscillospiraceae bacterium]|nr:hypothetical protein [Ruminococcus sp.]MCD8344493.1 hypothetical protein [Oscillospiraceae bacterium]